MRLKSFKTLLGSVTASFSAESKDNGRREEISEENRLQREDPWFYSHYVYAAQVVASKLFDHADSSRGKIFDFGCGDGIMALGVSQRAGVGVTGLDLTQAFLHLPDKAREVLHLAALPTTLRFLQVDAARPLPFDDNHFDGGYSWSVFEHVANVAAVLAEVHRILKPRAPFLLQIEPFYASPFGSHLKRLIDEPWAHLLMDENSYLERALAANDAVPDAEKDMMYRKNDFEHVKKYLVAEYRNLNRITVDRLLSHVLQAGFHIREMQTSRAWNYAIPPGLLHRYSEYDLRTNEVLLVITK
jgi:ubiquinone/menaquinone biosynthesis C-methylase UbiE